MIGIQRTDDDDTYTKSSIYLSKRFIPVTLINSNKVALARELFISSQVPNTLPFGTSFYYRVPYTGQ